MRDRSEDLVALALCRTAGRRCRVHIKADTGMGRIGVSPEEAPTLALAASESKNISKV